MPHDPAQRRPGTIHIWDPLAAWPSARRWMWAALAVLVSLTQGPGFVRSLTPAAGESVDFFQEWASARNFLDGAPIYTDLEVSAARYLGRRSRSGEGVMVSKNAHPPASVLLAVPFGLLDYPRATLIWNLLSLAAFAVSLVLLARELGLRPPPWAILPAITLLLICNPFRQQVNQGQFNLLLLLLMTGVWTAERSGRSALAGTLLGAATAFKLFPGFFFLYFLLRRRWTVVASGLAAIAILSLVSVAVLGQETYDSYLREVFPAMSTYRNWWSNASLAGFWVKWFDSGAVSTIFDPRLPSYLEPLAVRPAHRARRVRPVFGCRADLVGESGLRRALAVPARPGVRSDIDDDARAVANRLGSLLPAAASANRTAVDRAIDTAPRASSPLDAARRHMDQPG